MLTLPSKIALGATLLFTVGLAVRFYRRQNRAGTTGGRISVPKIAWLFYAIFVWFMLCPILALDPQVPLQVRWILGVFALSMWARGLIELYMLYVSHSWRPPYGIAHDVACILLIAGMAARSGGGMGGTWPALAAWLFVGVVVTSLIVEIAYAALFFRIVRGGTLGKEGVWFADEDPRFHRINRITAAGNAPLFLATAGFLAVCFFG